MSDLKYWLGFNIVKGVGPAKIQALLHHFDDLGKAWEASPATLQRLGFDRRTLDSLLEARRTVDLDRYLANVEAAGITCLTWNSPDYPSYLREVDSPPPVLYVRGALEEIDRWAVAVVGTRRVTTYGRQVTEDLVRSLVANGVTIVSGLARGVDSVAHRTALESGGRTIAVLGSGPDVVYPPEHRALAERIADGRGAVVTEYALGTPPDARNFPPRNRIISGLALGVVVVEAGKRSGALITAKFALEQGRDVFAVPGNITWPASAGPNRLIQQGAKLITSAEDILEELNLKMVLEQADVQLALPETPEEAALLQHLSTQPLHVDELCRATSMPSSMVSSTLALMELKGMVRQVGGMQFVRSREPDPVYHVSTTESPLTEQKTA